MRRRKYRNLPTFEKVEIIDLAAEGKALAKVKQNEDDDKSIVIFVTACVPGDIVDVKINKKTKNFMEGYPINFHKLSDLRIDARCSHFGTCGGCKWQSLPYDLQLKYKHKQVVDQLKHIGKFNLPEADYIMPSANEYYYRNKLEFTFSNKRWLTKDEINTEKTHDMDALGFHIPGKFDKILDIEHCYLQKNPSNDIRLFVKKTAKEHNMSFYDVRNESGFLRNIIIRSSTTGDLMLIVVFFYDDTQKRQILLEAVQKRFPEITSLMYVINPKKNDSISDLSVKLHSGKDHIFEQMDNLRFKIGPKSFYQTNSEQAYRLYSLTKQYADLQGDEIVYDLYTGTGTIANFVANDAKKVVGVEYVPEAIEDAKVNSSINNIDNTVFYAGDMKDVLNREFINSNGKPDVIILDPPRAGVHQKVIDAILKTDADRIVYVSCNAATQARDISLLSENYKLVKFQPVDMFPQTAHVENVALLVRK